jgi:bacteriorhodopsin
MWERQLIASFILSILLLVLIIRLVQKGRLDIAYCWLWLAIGIAASLVVARYDWLTRFSEIIGAVNNTTTLFLMTFFVVLLLCLQFSLVVSHQRRQLKRLTQQLALSHPLSKSQDSAPTQKITFRDASA